MPIITGVDGELQKINNIHTGGKDIDKVYVGEQLVYEKDSPVYMTKLSHAFAYSLDGINYNILEQYNTDERMKYPCYIKGKFLFPRMADNKRNQIAYFKTDDIKKGILNWYTFNIGTSSNNYIECMASDGDSVVVCAISNQSKIRYTLDGGATWNWSTTIHDGSKIVTYLGDGKFFISPKNTDETNPAYYYVWDKNNPTEINIATTTISRSQAIRCVRTCEDGAKYISFTIGSGRSATYRTTDDENFTKCEYNSTSTSLNYVTYVYGKYYALSGVTGGEYPNSGQYETVYDRNFYVSTDGINFTKIDVGNHIGQLFKSNGKLCFQGNNCAGIIHEDYTREYTSFNQTAAKYGLSNIVSNRFHKM